MKSNTSKIVFRVIVMAILLWFSYLFKVLSNESHSTYKSYQQHYDSLTLNPTFQQLPAQLQKGSMNINTALAKQHIISFEAYIISFIVAGALIVVFVIQIIQLIRNKTA